jgi:transposase
MLVVLRFPPSAAAVVVEIGELVPVPCLWQGTKRGQSRCYEWRFLTSMSFNQVSSSGIRFASRTNPQMSSDPNTQTVLYKFRGSKAGQQIGKRAILMEETNAKNEIEFVAFVGIDWADERHAWALQTSSGVEHGILTHTPEAVDAWAAELQCRFAGGLIAVALEQSRGALLFMLTRYEHLVLFPVHPTTAASYRQGFRPSGAKSDPSDAGLILELLVQHRDKLRRLNPDTTETRTLQFMVEQRRKFVDEKTRYSNRLTAHLKMYFPQALKWFSDITSEVAGAFLEKWPTLQKAQKARPETIRQFLIRHHAARAIDNRLEEISSGVAATQDTAVISSCSMAVVALARILRQVREAISGYDTQIETLAREHPDFAIFESFPGAGRALAPRLIAAVGTQRERFHNAGELQSYCGIAPVLASSGKMCWVHWRWACPKFLRQTFHEWAGITIRYSAWAKTYYNQQRARGKSRHVAIRALAFKWMRIVFRCWKDRQPYNDDVYSQAQARRSDPVPTGNPTVQFQWKKNAGFSKMTGLIS